MMTGVKQTFLALFLVMAGCSRQPEAPSPAPSSPSSQAAGSALEMYDISLNTDTVTPGQQISFCFKAHNAVSVTGFPGKFFKNGSLDGDCLVHTPQVDTLYRIEVTGSDGTKRSQTSFVKVRKSN
jgi:hypothetical protein